jgi:hypothetical protein
MNPKYKPGIFFGIFCAITSFINTMFIFPSTDHTHHLWGIIVSALIGGAVGGFIYGWFTIWYKAKRAKSAE